MAVRKKFWFNNKCSTDFDMYLTGAGTFGTVAKTVNKYSVPGRNGALIVSDDHFENQSYQITAGFFGDNEYEFERKCSKIRNWLLLSNGYCRLEDDYHPDEYRMAAYIGGDDISVTNLLHGEIVLNFDCQPQHFLKAGEEKIVFTNSGSLDFGNDLACNAKPLVRIYGTGQLVIGDGIIEVLKAGSSYIDVDCSSCQAYEQGEYRNENIKVSYKGEEHVFPEISPLKTTVSFPSTITKVEIIPRWWTL